MTFFPGLAVADWVVPWWCALLAALMGALASWLSRQTGVARRAAELRLVARSANCFLWHADVREENGEFLWGLRIFAEELDAFSIVEQLPPSSKAYTWYYGRVHEELVRLGDTARAAMRGGAPGYRQEFRCRDAAGNEVWFAEDVTVERAAPNAWKLVGVSTDITERKKAEAEVKQLSGLLPICSSCKKVRDDAGYWRQIEVYIRNRAAVQFSHGLCPDCKAKLYPGMEG
ncbi:MAG TPA: hypothetical protein VIH35_00325 [Kiritimatiellia bacterium]|jgi:PAS domain-containing protein